MYNCLSIFVTQSKTFCTVVLRLKNGTDVTLVLPHYAKRLLCFKSYTGRTHVTPVKLKTSNSLWCIFRNEKTLWITLRLSSGTQYFSSNAYLTLLYVTHTVITTTDHFNVRISLDKLKKLGLESGRYTREHAFSATLLNFNIPSDERDEKGTRLANFYARSCMNKNVKTRSSDCHHLIPRAIIFVVLWFESVISKRKCLFRFTVDLSYEICT